MDNNYEFIRNSTYFDYLDNDACLELAKNVKNISYEKDDYIKFPGKKCSHVYVIKKGLVKGGIYSKYGDELNSGRFSDNDLFGLSSVIRKTSADFFYQAIEDTNLIAIETPYFSSLLKDNGTFCYSILQIFGNSFLKSIDKRIDNIFYDNRTQIIKFILQLVKQDGQKIGQETLVKHQMTTQEIANFIGCTRQSVSQVLSELKKESILYSYDRNSFLIKDVDVLKSKILSK